MRFAFDQLLNPRSIAFRPAGMFEDRAVIAGRAGTATSDPASLELFELFAKQIRHAFSRIKSFHVGTEAERLMASGRRLTTSIASPAQYDLAR